MPTAKMQIPTNLKLLKRPISTSKAACLQDPTTHPAVHGVSMMWEATAMSILTVWVIRQVARALAQKCTSEAVCLAAAHFARLVNWAATSCCATMANATWSALMRLATHCNRSHAPCPLSNVWATWSLTIPTLLSQVPATSVTLITCLICIMAFIRSIPHLWLAMPLPSCLATKPIPTTSSPPTSTR